MPIREIFSANVIADRVKWIGQAISQDFSDKSLTVVPVLRGSFIFAGDLVRTINLPNISVDFIGVNSYGDGTSSSGVTRLTHDLTKPIKDKNILIVEDIVDTGLTMRHIIDTLSVREPASISVCALLHKPARTRVPVKIDYLCFTIEDKFVVGYGLDYQDKYRNLPFIGEICA